VRLRPAEQKSCSVKPARATGGRAQRRAATTDVFDHHSAQRGLILSAHGRPNGVERTARREWNHEPDCRVGYVLCDGVREMAGSAAPPAARCRNVRRKVS